MTRIFLPNFLKVNLLTIPLRGYTISLEQSCLELYRVVLNSFPDERRETSFFGFFRVAGDNERGHKTLNDTGHGREKKKSS